MGDGYNLPAKKRQEKQVEITVHPSPLHSCLPPFIPFTSMFKGFK